MTVKELTQALSLYDENEEVYFEHAVGVYFEHAVGDYTGTCLAITVDEIGTRGVVESPGHNGRLKLVDGDSSMEPEKEVLVLG